MKTFLKRALQFLAPLALVVAAVVAWAFLAMRSAYMRNIRLPPGTRFVVMGDSEPVCALDPGVVTGLVNQACVGMPLDQTLYKVRDLLATAGDADFTFVLAISPRRLVAGFKPLAATDYEGHYAILNYLHMFDSRRALADPVRLFRDRVIPSAFHEATGFRFKKRRRKRKDTNQNVAWGGFTAFPGAHYVDEPEKARLETEHYSTTFLRDAAVDPDFQNGVALAGEIIDMVQASGRRVVLVTHPWHRSLLGSIPPDVLESFRRSMRRLAESRGVEWIDDLEMDMPDALFLDKNHLNADGARPYSEKFAKRLKGE